MSKICYLLLCIVLLLVSVGCGSTPVGQQTPVPAASPLPTPALQTPVPAASPLPTAAPHLPILKANASVVSFSADGSSFAGLKVGVTQNVDVGNRFRTEGPGEGELTLSCARILIYGGSDLHLEEMHATGANLSFSGSQLYSSACGDTIQLTTSPPPAQAIVQSHGTVFLAVYNPAKQMTLLWTVSGEPVLSDGQGKGLVVPAGQWSLVRNGGQPEKPRPVSAMGNIITQLELRSTYDAVVKRLQSEGFGPGAPRPLAVATIVK